jgi:phage gpG-like protein
MPETFKPGAKIARWERNLENPSAALKAIGALMVAESQGAFKAQRFGGDVWRARGPVNVFGIIADFHAGKRAPAQRRFQTRPALQDTGRLRMSIAFQVSGDTVAVGSNLPYAAVHQEGGKSTSAPITEKVQQALWRWLKKQGSDLKAKLGFLLNKKYTGQTLEMTVPKRPFVGITRQTLRDVKEAVGVHIMEVR